MHSITVHSSSKNHSPLGFHGRKGRGNSLGNLLQGSCGGLLGDCLGKRRESAKYSFEGRGRSDVILLMKPPLTLGFLLIGMGKGSPDHGAGGSDHMWPCKKLLVHVGPWYPKHI